MRDAPGITVYQAAVVTGDVSVPLDLLVDFARRRLDAGVVAQWLDRVVTRAVGTWALTCEVGQVSGWARDWMSGERRRAEAAAAETTADDEGERVRGFDVGRSDKLYAAAAAAGAAEIFCARGDKYPHDVLACAQEAARYSPQEQTETFAQVSDLRAILGETAFASFVDAVTQHVQVAEMAR